MFAPLRRILVLGVLFIMIIGPSFSASMAEARPPDQIVVVEITLDPHDGCINATTDTAGSGTYYGNLTVNKPPLLPVQVQLDASVSTGWPVTASPQSFDFTTSGTEAFTITVVVPQGSSISSMGRLTVTALATWAGGSSTSTASGTVFVCQYYGATAETDPGKGTENPTKFDLKVFNMGNGLDTFDVSIANKSKEEGRGFSFNFNKTSTQKVAPGDFERFSLRVGYSIEARSGEHVFYIRITSLGAKKNGTGAYYWDIPVKIEVKNIGGGGASTYGVVAGIVILIIAIVVVVVILRKRKRKKARSGTTKKEETNKAKD
jgi:hypothetical protein